MQSFYKITKLLKDLLEADEDVNTIIFGRTEDKDIYKKNIYPLAHINPLSSDFTSSQQNVFVFEIACLDQRDLSNQLEEEKFEGNSNFIDNLNTCHAVLNRLVSTLRLQSNCDRIELLSASLATPVMFAEHNILDGWLLNLTLAIPNNIDICLP